MLIKANHLRGFQLHGIDGDLGKVEDFYFDDRHWIVRYLVAKPGNWLTSRQVLISPQSLISVDPSRGLVSVSLTKAQIESSPELGQGAPLSRTFEHAYYDYYRWPTYWTGPYMWGSFPFITREISEPVTPESVPEPPDHRLRNTDDVRGLILQASDGELGHVEDFVIDDVNWAIRYLIIDTRNWWPGKRVLISPQWLQSMNWNDEKVFADVSRDMIMSAPEYTDDLVITRDFEESLHRHFKLPGYWADELKAPAVIH